MLKLQIDVITSLPSVLIPTQHYEDYFLKTKARDYQEDRDKNGHLRHREIFSGHDTIVLLQTARVVIFAPLPVLGGSLLAIESAPCHS